MPCNVRSRAISGVETFQVTNSLSQFIGTRILKLLQKSPVAFKKRADIINPEFQHRNPFQSHAKSKAADLFRIIDHRLENSRVHHRSEERRVGKECRSRWS